jgi:RNA polymerase sigma factor (sigma-70 family)
MANDHADSSALPQSGDDIDPLLSRWEDDIKRAASAAARRRMLGNDLLEEIAQEARTRVVRIARRGGPCEEPYIRMVISNATRGAARQEAQSLERLLASDTTHNEPPDGLDVSSSETMSLTKDAVSKWLHGLTARFQAIYDLLYVQGHTQREAAAIIGITQPRVAQLHRDLLRRGRMDLAGLVA